MFFAKPIIAYNVVYNRETTGNKAIYFTSTDELHQALCTMSEKSGNDMLKIAQDNYTWKHITELYESLY